MDQLRSLRVFSAVVAAGSFAGAARALDLAPAVVTRAVAELEAHLGARLLQRTTRRVALTAAGETYLPTVRRLLAELDDADALAGSSTHELRGRLRVMAPPAFAVHQLAPVLAAFRERHPRLMLDVALRGAVAVPDESFDVSIVSSAGRPLSGEFVARRLALSYFVLCAAPAYLARRGTPASPHDLLTHEGLLPAVSAQRRELSLERDGEQVRLPTPAVALASDAVELLLAAARAGAGIAALPSFAAAAGFTSGTLVRVLPEWRGLPLGLFAAMPSRKHLPAPTRAFVDCLVQAFGGREADPWLAA